jgi:hypothetical protein
MFPFCHDTSCVDAKKIMDANWITAISTLVYTGVTAWLILDQQESRLGDKFLSIVVRAREDPCRQPGATGEIRLVNVGRGPAFIEHFHVTGLSDGSRPDGNHSDDIDRAIGPDVGDPRLQVAFALCRPEVLRQPDVTIIIRYHDIARRVFTSGIRNGQPFYEPPWQQGR